MFTSIVFPIADLSPEDRTSMLEWGLALIVLVVIAFVAVSYYRRRLLEKDDEQSSGFSLSQLRELHRNGQLSDEEFEKSKAVLVATLKAAAEKAAQRRAETQRNK